MMQIKGTNKMEKMTVNEALEKSIETLRKIRIPISEIMGIGVPINDVANT